MLDDATLRLLSEGRNLDVLGCELEVRPHRILANPAGYEMQDFLSASYLGISDDADLVEACHETLRRQGLYRYSSPVFRCSRTETDLRSMLADATGLPSVRFYSSVSLLHVDMLGAMAGKSPVYVDRSAHYSIFRALRGCAFKKYAHNDLNALRSMVHADGSGLIVTDSVFSMSGEVVDISEIGAFGLAESCCVYLDDSHGVGVLEGKFVSAGQRLVATGADVVYVGTLGKAMSCPLAFVCYDAESAVGKKIERRGLSYVFSGRPSDLEFEVACVAVRNHLAGRYDENLGRLNKYCRHIVDYIGPHLQDSMRVTTDGWGIVALWVGELPAFRTLCIALRSAEIAFDVVGFPAVERGTFLARFCVSAAHAQGQIDQLCASLLAGIKDLRPS